MFLSYYQRWKLELLFDRYKNDEMFDYTSVQSDYSVIGSEFINLISTTIISRILQRCEQLGLLDDCTYANLMHDLRTCWRKVDATDEVLSGDDSWVHTYKRGFQILETLGLSRNPEEKRPSGIETVEDEKPKRPHGRPSTKPAEPKDLNVLKVDPKKLHPDH